MDCERKMTSDRTISRFFAFPETEIPKIRYYSKINAIERKSIRKYYPENWLQIQWESIECFVSIFRLKIYNASWTIKSAIVPNLSANIFSLSINRLAHEHSFRAESILNHTYRLYKPKHKHFISTSHWHFHSLSIVESGNITFE